MSPRIKIQKEDILRAAVDIVRRKGEGALNARDLAAALNCSTQPIFSNYATMDLLRQAVLGEAYALCQAHIREEQEKGEFPPYKASGMAYIRFAQEEKELFKLLYLCDRGGAPLPEDDAIGAQAHETVQNHTGLSPELTKLFHLEMWVYVHGIATMTATGFLDLDRDLVSRMLSDSYLSLKKHFEKE